MTTINCPVCEHDIDSHCFDGGPICWDCDLSCGLSPSDIARALLTAEPTDTEVRAAAKAAKESWRHMACTDDDWAIWNSVAHSALATARKAQTNA